MNGEWARLLLIVEAVGLVVLPIAVVRCEMARTKRSVLGAFWQVYLVDNWRLAKEAYSNKPNPLVLLVGIGVTLAAGVLLQLLWPLPLLVLFFDEGEEGKRRGKARSMV